MIGRPIVNWMNNIRLKKLNLPAALSAFLVLLFLTSIFCMFFVLLIPVLVNEAKVISSIDLQTITLIYQEPINTVETYLRTYNIIAANQTLETLLSEKIMKLLQMINFSDTFTTLLSFAGSFLISIFSILFITFFFLKDANMFNHVLMLFTPEEYQTELKHVLISSRKHISRYFIGLLIEMILMTILLWIGLSVIGINNALLIAFIGGIMVIIPYIGVIIGTIVALVFGITTALSANVHADILQIAFQILLVYGIVKIIDDFVLQPLIYSNSVKAHPLEIFLVILMAGSIAGISGMVLAIPTYTFLRIVAKEFLSQLKFVQKLTEKL
jgi:predicted PurR-regulated permease PerM